MKNCVKGYKVFNSDWTCRGKQYKVGEVFEENITPKVCAEGMHFCLKLKDCFSYYSFDVDNKVAEVVALGMVDKSNDDSKVCTNKLQIVKELSWSEVLEMVNEGRDCTGDCNTGDWNTGDWNTGNRNTGNRNTGDCNTGNRNTGNRNTGFCNTGNRNTGNRNTGFCNTGNRNTGNRNTGDWNTGDCNTGDWNTGDWNTGNRNTGDWNTGDCNTGCFNTIEPNIYMFNKPTNLTYKDWLHSRCCALLNSIPHKILVEWVYKEDMTEEEKEQYPTYKTTGGYLKTVQREEVVQKWWDSLNCNDKECILSMPNFDAEIFKECTGIDVNQEV